MILKKKTSLNASFCHDGVDGQNRTFERLDITEFGTLGICKSK